MEYFVTSGHLTSHKPDCWVIGVYEDRKLTPSASSLDEISQGFLSELLKRGDIRGEIGKISLVPVNKPFPCHRILFVGCGKKVALKDNEFRKIIIETAKNLKLSAAKDVLWTLAELDVHARDISWKLQQSLFGIEQALYEFTELKTVLPPQTVKLNSVAFHVHSSKEVGVGELIIQESIAITQAQKLVKTLANLPSNICTPSFLSKQAKQISKEFPKVKTTILNEAELKKLGMNAFLAVSRGSDEPLQFIVMEYRGTQKSKDPLVLIGKGITFDSGGISLKDPANMDEMKYDMCGAATVLGVIQACAQLSLPINLVGLICATENLPSGHATKPGDIVKTLSGQTVEILNTDAEGRLVLCDALTYAERFKPELVIDIATLTGAVIIALGEHATGVMTNHEPSAKEIIAAGEYMGDRAWQLPVWDEYQEGLESNFADIANVAGRPGGAIRAAWFLSRFAKNFHWVHLDIAGTAWLSGKAKGATGRPVLLLMQFILNRCHH